MRKIIVFIYVIFHAVTHAQVMGTPYMAVPIVNYPKTCNEILTANASAPSGAYTIDVDGPGGTAPFNCYCDMTTDSGGWTLVAIRNSSASAMFSETAIAPVLPASAAGSRLSAIWVLSNTSFSFNNIRFTNAGTSFTSKAIATFASATTLSGLNSTYASYSQSPTNATVTTTGVTGTALTNFYFRGKSGNVAPFDDLGADWAVFTFSTGATLTSTDTWDTAGAYWILAGLDKTNDPMISTLASGGSFTNGTLNNAHWPNNNRTQVTYVWLK